MDNLARIQRIAQEHQGRITAQDDYGNVRVEFDWHLRAAGFYDDVFCRDWATVIENTQDHVTVKI